MIEGWGKEYWSGRGERIASYYIGGREAGFVMSDPGSGMASAWTVSNSGYEFAGSRIEFEAARRILEKAIRK